MPKRRWQRRTQLSPGRRELAERYIPLARSLASRFVARAGRPRLIDDARSVALLALSQAAADYRPEPGLAFATFGRFRIVRELSPLAISERTASFGDPPPEVDLLLSEENRWIGHIDDRDEVDYLLSTLPPGPGSALRMTVLEALWQSEVAAALGISQATVGRLMLEGAYILFRRIQGYTRPFPADSMRFACGRDGRNIGRPRPRPRPVKPTEESND